MVQAKQCYDVNDPCAKVKHRGILMMIVTDLQPFSIVNDPGFLHYSKLLDPRFTVASRAPESWHRRCRTNHIWLDKMRVRRKNIWHFMARAKKSCLTLTWLLDTLSNDYCTHCPMSIGHIFQWLLNTLSNDYGTKCPIYIGQNPKCLRNIQHLVHRILVNSIFHGQCVQDILDI